MCGKPIGGNNLSAQPTPPHWCWARRARMFKRRTPCEPASRRAAGVWGGHGPLHALEVAPHTRGHQHMLAKHTRCCTRNGHMLAAIDGEIPTPPPGQRGRGAGARGVGEGARRRVERTRSGERRRALALATDEAERPRRPPTRTGGAISIWRARRRGARQPRRTTTAQSAAWHTTRCMAQTALQLQLQCRDTARPLCALACSPLSALVPALPVPSSTLSAGSMKSMSNSKDLSLARDVRSIIMTKSTPLDFVLWTNTALSSAIRTLG